jgi:hypothetical protein
LQEGCHEFWDAKFATMITHAHIPGSSWEYFLRRHRPEPVARRLLGTNNLYHSRTLWLSTVLYILHIQKYEPGTSGGFQSCPFI